MYKRNAQGWSRHLDFMLWDIFSLIVAFILAVLIRSHIFAYASQTYRILGAIIILADAFVLVANDSMHNVMKRGYYKELSATFKHCFIVFAITAIYMFAVQEGDVYSRISLFLTFIFHIFFGFCIRIIWKKVVVNRGKVNENKRTMLVVADPEAVDDVLEHLLADTTGGYKVAGVVLTKDTDLTELKGVPIVSDFEHAADYICRAWIDSVYIDAPLNDHGVIRLMDDCGQMAVPIHYHFPSTNSNGAKRFSEKIGGTTVLTTSVNYATPIQMAMKRCADIIGAIVGCFLTLIVIAIVGPKIKKASPGPIIFKQERIGKNGKHFMIYKIRSMYMDADKRKKELLAQNRVKDGMMFKLDFDPRVIGNEILPDGTVKTGIGDKIRRLSLDEFPQFFNVLLGQMSLVGTRPPTPDEWEKYEYRHRARLAVKPGITGMWQVSGRSEITDFEEVVKLDTFYITNWSPGMDIRILFKTIKVIFERNGAM